MIELSIHINSDRIEEKVVGSKEELRKTETHFYDAFGFPIETYRKIYTPVVEAIVTINNISHTLNEIVNGYNKIMTYNIKASISHGNGFDVTVKLKDSVDLGIFISTFSEYLYDLFDKEVEF